MMVARIGERSSVNAVHTLPVHGRRATGAGVRRTPLPLPRRAAPRSRPPPPPRTATPRRPLGRRAAGRHHPRIRIHPADGLPGPRERGASPQGRRTTSCRQQLPDGGWSNYPGGPVELSVSVKAYFALKLAGHDPDAPYMRRAARRHPRARRRRRLQQLHQVLPRPARPVPLRQLRRPCRRRWCCCRSWVYFNIYAMSSWTRTIVVPLSIFSALQAGAAGCRRNGASPNCS